MLPAVRETVVVERRKERGRDFLSKPPRSWCYFSPYALDSACDVLLKPRVPLIVRRLVSQPVLPQLLCPTLLDYTVELDILFFSCYCLLKKRSISVSISDLACCSCSSWPWRHLIHSAGQRNAHMLCVTQCSIDHFELLMCNAFLSWPQKCLRSHITVFHYLHVEIVP